MTVRQVKDSVCFENDLNKTIDYFQQYVDRPDIEYYYRAMLAFLHMVWKMEIRHI